jgi:predicted cupin superfamily sugar epimerase
MTDRLSQGGRRTSRRLGAAVNTGRWIERLITAGFAAFIFLGAATLFGCFVLMFAYVWGAIL